MTDKKKPRASIPARGARTRGPSIRGTSSTQKRKPAQRNVVYTGALPKGKKRAGARRSRLRRALGNLIMMAMLMGGGALLYMVQDLPDIRNLSAAKKERGITFESEDGKMIATYGDVVGRFIPYREIPRPMIQAVLATEDRRFFSHMGVDIWGIIRAAFVNATAGKVLQGGSTITQQLAKNVFLTPERSIMRKLQEALLALALEARYSKEEIMAIYLNRVYLGSGVFGIDAAAKRYFNTNGHRLNLSQAAMIAGMLKAPSRYSPTNSKEKAIQRADQALVNMHDAGMLNDHELATARVNLKTTQVVQTTEGNDARYFTDWVMEELPGLLGSVEEDVVVTTTLQPRLQGLAEDAVQQVIAEKGGAMRASQGALVAMSPDGAVRAMVGGTNYFKAPYNRAVQAQRQPGSAFKMFVYLAAIEAGLSPTSLVLDAPISLMVNGRLWSPENYGRDFKGEITLAQAMRESLNTVAVRIGQYAGFSRVAQAAMRLGISNVPSHPSIALGSKETNLISLTSAYAHMPNHGMSVKPYGVLSVRSLAGKEIYERKAKEPRQLIASDVVEQMNYLMMGVVSGGTGTRARLPGRQVAGKTGTSQEFKDAWFMGYTAQLATGVWVGNDDNRSMLKVTGGSLPATIWHDFMVKAVADMPVEPLPARSSGGGFLPWLFGIDALPEEGANPPGVEEVPSGEATPLPFEVKDNQGNVIAPEPLPVVEESAAPRIEEVDPQSASPQQADESPLPKGFLEKLVEDLPAGDVKYEYPNDKR